MAQSSTHIPIPKDWQDFERKTRILFECLLGDPQTQTHGRGGDAQDGVDAFGRRDGGKGRLVGVQCKGKEGHFGKQVTEAELRKELTKTEGFKPDLEEFILATTAPDSPKVQAFARKLEQEEKEKGREIVVAFWGWDQLEQHINEHPRAIRAFHPDYTPISDKLLEGQELSLRIQSEIQATLENHGEVLSLLAKRVQAQSQTLSPDLTPTGDQADAKLDAEIDQYRELITEGKPETALKLLNGLKDRAWGTVSDRLKFRILGNIGSAYHRLNDLAEAARSLIEAASYQPEMPLAVAHKIAGLLMQGEREEADTQAKAARLKFPDSADVARQWLQCSANVEAVRERWDELSGPIQRDAGVQTLKCLLLRELESPSWRDEAKSALDAHPAYVDLQRLVAEAIVEEALEEDPGNLGFGTTIDPERLKFAADMLASIWKRSLNREEQPDFAAVHNGALAYLALADEKSAVALLDEGLQRGAGDETRKLRVLLHFRNGETDRAIAIAEKVTASPERELGLAQLLLDDRPGDARKLLEGAEDQLVNERQRLGAYGLLVDSYIHEEDWSGASEVLKKAKGEYPHLPEVYLIEHRVLRAQGQPSKLALDRAAELLQPESESSTRFFIATQLEEASCHDEAANLLEGFVSVGRDSPALRLYLAAALNADRRVTVAQTLDALPAEVRALPFYGRLGATLAIRAGDLPLAEARLADYLSG